MCNEFSAILNIRKRGGKISSNVQKSNEACRKTTTTTTKTAVKQQRLEKGFKLASCSDW